MLGILIGSILTGSILTGSILTGSILTGSILLGYASDDTTNYDMYIPSSEAIIHGWERLFLS